MLHRLLFRSRLVSEAAPDLSEILIDGQRNNRVSGISGMLIVDRCAAIQILEGPLEPLEATFERICRDLRHRDVRVIEFVPSLVRSFGEPGMHRIPATPSTRLLIHALHGDGDMGTGLTANEAAIQLLRTLMTTRVREQNGHQAFSLTG